MKSLPRDNFDLLFACMQKDVPAHIPDLLKGKIAWPELTALARQEHLTPLLFWALKETDCLGRVPPAYASGFSAAYNLSLARNIRLRQHYDEISSLLSTNGVAHCPLRGIDWAFSVYPSPGLRPMSDVDLLVPPQCMPKVRAVLARNGYSHLPQEAFFTHHDIVMKSGVVFEIHSYLANAFVRTVFREMDNQPDLNVMQPVLAQPLASLHYWVKKKRHAVWISDFLRLPQIDSTLFSWETRTLLSRTKQVISQAQNGNYDALFFSSRRPDSFWLLFLPRVFLRAGPANPQRLLRLGSTFMRWQKDRVRFRQWASKQEAWK